VGYSKQNSGVQRIVILLGNFEICLRVSYRSHKTQQYFLKITEPARFEVIAAVLLRIGLFLGCGSVSLGVLARRGARNEVQVGATGALEV
jgi:hypothetical protein